MGERESQITWKRYLYLEQNFSDNHVDKSFLKDLRQNVNLKSYTFCELVLLSLPVSIQLNSIVIFLLVFHGIRSRELSASLVFITNILVVTTIYSAWIVLHPKLYGNPVSNVVPLIKETLLIVFIVMSLSPVLEALTISVSTNTIIFTISPILLLMNLLFHNYSSTNEFMYKYPETFSINAGTMAAYLLASRLKTNFEALALILAELILLVAFPLFRRLLKKVYPKSIVIFPAIEIPAIVLISARRSKACAIWYFLCTVLITNIAPLLFLYLQRFKRKYCGPWDEARINTG